MNIQQPRTEGNTEGFDRFAGKNWIYPNNMQIRQYQKTAVEKSLFTNSMIVLPTGFGKTFIAAVVMYNFHRWYPEGKIIFVAPTRPLVHQQIDECKRISGIPYSDCVELTGQIKGEKRVFYWKEKRVFFATPQVIDNDLADRTLPATDVKCIVIDEAHRAQGDYAYVNIVRQLHERNRNGFRVMALSATPGSDMLKVQQVMLNLFIGDVMFLSENSLELMSYRHQKMSKAWSVELQGTHKRIVDAFINMCKPVFKDLYQSGCVYNQDSVEKSNKFTLIQASKKINSNDHQAPGRISAGKLKYLCFTGISLVHSFEMLTIYGLRPFYCNLQKNLNKSTSGLKTALGGKVEFDKILDDIKSMFGEYLEPDPNKDANGIDLFKGHPKLTVVKDLLMKHFKEKEGTESRAMVFSKYRVSVNDIVQALRSLDPVIKATTFVGQNDADGAGMSQKEQIQRITDFKAGKYNVLVCTCVAEEGLDIGEVDLIICYDTSGSVISNTQRRGRTGRKRAGDVQTIVTKGYEEKKHQKAGSSKRQVEEQLYNRNNYMNHRYRDAPRLVPLDINPYCLEHRVEPVADEEDEEPKPKRQKRMSTPKSEPKGKVKTKKKTVSEPDSPRSSSSSKWSEWSLDQKLDQ